MPTSNAYKYDFVVCIEQIEQFINLGQVEHEMKMSGSFPTTEGLEAEDWRKQKVDEILQDK